MANTTSSSRRISPGRGRPKTCYACNNAMQDNTWATGTTASVAVAAIADLPASGFMTLSAPADLAAYGRFRVGANQNATVRIIVCGWSG